MSTNDKRPRRTYYTLTYVTLVASTTWFAVDQPGAHSATAPARGGRATDAVQAPTPKPTPSAVPPPLTRDVFEYMDEGYAARVLLAPPTPEVAPAPPVPVPQPLVRLIGLAVVDGTTKAILALAGGVEIMAVGESAAGYTVQQVDADGPTVLLKHGDEELTLTPPSEP
jgi:hypothetical protein